MPCSSAGKLRKPHSSPRKKLSSMGKRSPLAIELLKELRQNDSTPSAPSSALSSSPLGQDSLDGIQNQASLIAEMRPNRRKIRWQTYVSDWERRCEHQPKSAHMDVGINLQDLDVFNASGLSDRKDTTQSPPPMASPRRTKVNDLRNSPSLVSRKTTAEDEIEALELKIQRIHKTIARLEDETADLNEQTDQLKEQNHGLRNEIHGIPSHPLCDPSKRGSNQQLSEELQRLNIHVSETDRQVSLLNEETDAVHAATSRLAAFNGLAHLQQSSTFTLAPSVELSLSLSSSSEEEEEEELQSPRSEILIRPHYRHSSRSTSSLPSRTPCGRPPLPSRRALSAGFRRGRDHRLGSGSSS